MLFLTLFRCSLLAYMWNWIIAVRMFVLLKHPMWYGTINLNNEHTVPLVWRPTCLRLVRMFFIFCVSKIPVCFISCRQTNWILFVILPHSLVIENRNLADWKVGLKGRWKVIQMNRQNSKKLKQDYVPTLLVMMNIFLQFKLFLKFVFQLDELFLKCLHRCWLKKHVALGKIFSCLNCWTS